jgi:hypothetical protein
MINYQVEDLDAVLEALRAEGVTIDPKREDYDYGRFAWIMDPEGKWIRKAIRLNYGSRRNRVIGRSGNRVI